jgi:hypothetical protein
MLLLPRKGLVVQVAAPGKRLVEKTTLLRMKAMLIPTHDVWTIVFTPEMEEMEAPSASSQEHYLSNVSSAKNSQVVLYKNILHS